MATIKAIEGRSVHQIQSGQVIVDLCSVVKELVENSLDAGATSIDVRFKNHGLESIEVQDNGSGISPENYQSLALKHYTSKLANYDDLSSLKTFGFRGEALSSLCALSCFHVVTARAEEVPKGTRLDFETSGVLKGTKVVASQQGTTVAVENLFNNLPVRRRELEKNNKREYGKVLGVLQAYACISKGVKFGVSHQLANGKKAVVFATKSNPSTRENIANVFGAKTLTALIPLDLKFELQSGAGQRWSTQEDGGTKEVRIVGHISKPIFGEGRQTPDRQMFFVNARPCSLPQVAKAFNEVYKSYNISQSPFIFANLVLDTNAYDVNVSPDKRTILLHDQNAMLEALKTSVTELFDRQDHTVPHSQLSAQRIPPFRQLTLNQETNIRGQPCATSAAQSIDEDAPPTVESDDDGGETRTGNSSTKTVAESTSLIQKFVGRNAEIRADQLGGRSENEGISKEKQKLTKKLGKGLEDDTELDDDDDTLEVDDTQKLAHGAAKIAVPVLDFNQRIAEQEALKAGPGKSSLEASATHHHLSGTLETHSQPTSPIRQASLTRIPSKRSPIEIATITIGSKTIVSSIGTPSSKRQRLDRQPSSSVNGGKPSKFGSSLRAFAAPGARIGDESGEDGNEDDEEGHDIHYKTESGQASKSEVEEAAANSNGVLASSSDDSVADGSHARQLPLGSQEEDSDEDPLDEADNRAHEDTDEDYLDEAESRAQEEAKVAQLIQRAEEDSARPSQDNEERAKRLLRGRIRKDSTTQLVQAVSINGPDIAKLLEKLAEAVGSCEKTIDEEVTETADSTTPQESAEQYLSLTVLKDDFARMRIVGQFNLGFILVTRPANPTDGTNAKGKDEVFIIDQHASDEKYNFERLQSETTVQNQPLVKPNFLDLTAMEEEIIMGHLEALEKNGFLIEVDNSGEAPVGKRCRLFSVPMSREVVFNARDLEELLALLAESPHSTSTSNIPRPSKVRRMFAMRACRSSVMVGKTLTWNQMGKIVTHMGEIDKPWNCPHGRPTMRHLMGLNTWDSWTEGDGIAGLNEQALSGDEDEKNTIWAKYIERAKPHD